MDIDITIAGITPLLCNRFSDAAAEKASGGFSPNAAAQDRGTPLEIATTKLYRDLDKRVCIPQPNLLRALVEGGRFHKIGKVQITTAKSSLLYACVDIEGVTIPIVHREPWRVDTRPVRIPATGGRILAHRPMFDDWSLTFTVNLDTSILSAGLFRQIVDDSGKRIGLGDFRPPCKGPFGRFVVTHWEVQQIALAAE